MSQAQRPENEMERLATLRALDILDTAPEDSFDRLTRLAVRFFDVPIAHLSLVDEHREWFKSKCGVDIGAGSRQNAICAHTVLSDEVVVVEDASLDPRFRDNPQASEDRPIRFYAGAPLRTRSGVVIGALCIKGYEPRKVSPQQIQVLEELASVAVEEMEHRLVEAELRKWQHVFDRAEWGIAMADGDQKTLAMVNRKFAELHGYTPEEMQGMPIEEIFAPEFRPTVPHHVQTLLERGHHVYESIHIRKDGTTFPVQIDSTVVRDSRGRLMYRAAQIQDLADRKRVDQELRFKNAILSTQQETSLDGILVVDTTGKIVTCNRRFAELWNLPEEVLASESDDVALKYVTDQIVDYQQFLQRVRYLYDHPTESSRDVVRLHDGRVFNRYSTAMTGPDGEQYGRIWYFTDVTEQVRVEQSLRDSEERMTRILESAMDAIITLDEDRHIELFNSAAEDIFRCSAADVMGQSFDRLASESLAVLLDSCDKAFSRRGAKKRYMWAPEGVTARRASGEEFPIEATISQADVSGRRLLTIILRDVNERTEAEHELQSLQQKHVYLQEELKSELGFEEIVGRSPPIQKVLQDVQQVAGTPSTVMLVGETGTGKELIARAIHRLSQRADQILVKVNCAALPAGLMESELFGHEKGAFTGALTRKMGRFELAHGGTLFLDEIGDLPLELQVKLLRVLQEGECERVGGTQTLAVDVRVIAATNRDLEREVQAGRFRPDLYYRLNVFPIHLPPLRDRRSDIPLLVQHFTLKHSARIGKSLDQITKETMTALTDYEWPGNVRELQNVIERAVILTHGDTLDISGTLPKSSTRAGQAATLEELERSHILNVLDQTGWKVSGPGGAAEILGLKRTTLEARMKKLGIRRRRR